MFISYIKYNFAKKRRQRIMKIFYLYTSLTTKGGADRILSVKANWLAAHGYDVTFVTDSQMGRTPIFPLDRGVRFIDLGINFELQYSYSLPVRFIMYRKMIKKYQKKLSALLYKETPDIVITTLGREMDFLTSIKDGSIKLGESHIARQFTRNFHLLEQRGLIYRIVAKYWRRKQADAVSKLDGLVLLTSRDERGWQNVTQKTFVIPNPLTFNTRAVSTCTNKRIISVGRLTEQKGYEYLLEAWRMIANKHSDWKLDIFGEGELKNELSSLIEHLGIGNTVKINPPTDSIDKEYANSSIYVMSSRFEGFGLVLTEAMECGLPCVSFDCPYGPREIIKNGEDGFLVDYLNVKELANTICKLIENDNLRKAMGLKAKNNVQRFNQDIVMQKWTSLFSQLKS